MKHIKLFEQFVNEGKLNYKDTGLTGQYLKDVKDGVAGIKRALKTGNKESLISNYDIIQQRIQQYGEGPNKYDFLEAVQKLAGLEESVNESSGKYLLIIKDGPKLIYRYSDHDTPELGGRQLTPAKAKQLMKDTNITVKNWIDTGNGYIPG